MTLSVYSQLRKKVAFSVGSCGNHTHLLAALKGIFRQDINSPRRLENINSIGELLNILEIRDALSEDNVNPLKVIAENVPNSSALIKEINDYEASYVPREYANYYASENTQNVSSAQIGGGAPTINTNAYGATMSNKKRQRINDTIIEEIGNFWRDLGRNLKIRECVIDDIDNNNKTLAQKASKIVEIYEQRADPQKWFFVLCEALEKARRRDLSKNLQQIMAMNI